MAAEGPTRADFACAATCPTCCRVVLDVDVLVRRYDGDQLTALDLVADMIGHVQAEHPQEVETYLRVVEGLGYIRPPTE